jgi:hypothetical protein
VVVVLIVYEYDRAATVTVPTMQDARRASSSTNDAGRTAGLFVDQRLTLRGDPLPSRMSMYGPRYMGARRATFVIGPDGTVGSQLGPALGGRSAGTRYVLGPWPWLVIVYEYDETRDIVTVLTMQDARRAQRVSRAETNPSLGGCRWTGAGISAPSMPLSSSGRMALCARHPEGDAKNP